MTLTLDNSQDWAVVDGTIPIVLEREQTTKDTSGGVVQTWAAVAACVGDLQPATSAVKERFMQMGLVVSYTVFLNQKIDARASDRLRIGLRNFQIIEGGYEEGFEAITGWPATCHVNESASSP